MLGTIKGPAWRLTNKTAGLNSVLTVLLIHSWVPICSISGSMLEPIEEVVVSGVYLAPSRFVFFKMLVRLVVYFGGIAFRVRLGLGWCRRTILMGHASARPALRCSLLSKVLQ